MNTSRGELVGMTVETLLQSILNRMPTVGLDISRLSEEMKATRIQLINVTAALYELNISIKELKPKIPRMQASCEREATIEQLAPNELIRLQEFIDYHLSVNKDDLDSMIRILESAIESGKFTERY